MSILKTILPILGYTSKLVKEDTRIDRLKTCVSCPFKRYFVATGTCLECGCFVREKVQLKNQECPLGFWDKEE